MTGITIIYKSGAKVHLRVKDFSLTKEGSKLLSVNWSEIHPRPMLFGVDEVAAIYEGKV